MNSILKVTQATKSYHGHVALSGVDLELYPGELLGLLGPNGAGKTTLIRSICGRLKLSSGSIELEGRPLRSRRDRWKLGFVPQELAIYPDLSVWQNLQAFGRLHGVRGAKLRERLDFALNWTQLTAKASSLARTLSGGMQRRLNIACGVLHEPRVILLDEPTVGVDPQSRVLIFEMLADLKAQGVGILLTTHQLDEAEHRCDRIVIVDQGRTIASGTLGQLIRTMSGAGLKLKAELRRASDDPLTAKSWNISHEMSDIDRDLPALLAMIKGDGYRVKGLSVSTASLHDVFLQLTGRELRE